MFRTIIRTVLWCLLVAGLVFTFQYFVMFGSVISSMIFDPQEHFPYGFVLGIACPMMIPVLCILGAIFAVELDWGLRRRGK
jgi:hypothetical protein